jgi:hypothetical protein
LRFARSCTLLEVRVPARGRLATIRPLPRMRKRHLARRSFFRARCTVRPRTFGTRQALWAWAAGAAFEDG